MLAVWLWSLKQPEKSFKPMHIANYLWSNLQQDERDNRFFLAEVGIMSTTM